MEKLQRTNKTLARQRDTCAAYIIELEGRPTTQQCEEGARARVVAEEQVGVLIAEATKLSATCSHKDATIAARDHGINEIQRDHKRDKDALEKLRGKRRADRKAIEDWSRRVVELEDAFSKHESTIAIVCKENCDLKDRLQDLSEIITIKDEQLDDLKIALDSAVTKLKSRNEHAKERNACISNYKEQLAKQIIAYRKLSDLFEEKRRTWEVTQVNNNRAACIAQAETRNNHSNWVKILREKNAVIAGLETTLSAAVATGDLTKHTQHVLKTHQDLRKKNAALSKDNKSIKTDLQNLLVTNQSKTELLTSYLKKIEALQAERTEAFDQVAQLTEHLEKRKKYAANLQDIIATTAASATQGGSPCKLDCVPRAVVNNIIAEAIAEYYTQAEQLRQELQQEKEASRDVQARLEQCNNDLFNHQTEEQDRSADVSRLERKVVSLEAEQKILEEQILSRNMLISAANAGVHPEVVEMYHLLRGQIYPLQLENRKLISEKCNLLNDNDRYRDEALETKAKCVRTIENWRSNYKNLETEYWSVAINERDQLHEELAYWKMKCGKEHFYSSTPSSRLVHDRRLLQYALLEGKSGLTMSMLPKEYFDPEFLRIVTQQLVWLCVSSGLTFGSIWKSTRRGFRLLCLYLLVRARLSWIKLLVRRRMSG
jgi:chromosome segregation ATPase